jgi:hypothetical protein
MVALALEVIVTYHGTVLDVRHLAPGGSFTIGPDGADLAATHPALPDTPHALATFDAAGHARVDLCAGLTATMLIDGRVDAVERPGGVRLLPGHKARVTLGDLALLFALVPAAAPLPREKVALIDRGSRRALALAAGLHALLLLIAFAFPVVAEGMKLDRIDFADPDLQFHFAPSREEEVVDLFEPAVRDETAGAADDGPTQLAVPRPRPQAPASGGEPSVAERKAAAQATANEMRTVLADALGSGDPLGAEAHAALGNLFGGEDGHAEALGGHLRPGFGGMGVAPGPGGGGPSVGVAMRTRGRGTEPGYGVPEAKIPPREGKLPTVVMREPAEVIGGLGREDIARVVRQHRNAVRYCYEKELQTRPDLEGKIVMRFVVGGNGAVLAAKAAESTLADPSVEQCLARQIQTWQFPAVQGGGVVVVRYPFLFRSGRG